MRQRPKQSNYLEKFKDVKGEEVGKSGYDKDGRRKQQAPSRNRDPSPIVDVRTGKNVRGTNKVSTNKSSAQEESTLPSSGFHGAVVKQYKNLDDVPDGLPESPRWGTSWVPRSVAVSPRADYDEEDDENYWTTTVSPAKAPPVRVPQTYQSYQSQLSPREEMGYREHDKIPLQSYRPMRPMPSEEEATYGDRRSIPPGRVDSRSSVGRRDANDTNSPENGYSDQNGYSDKNGGYSSSHNHNTGYSHSNKPSHNEAKESSNYMHSPARAGSIRHQDHNLPPRDHNRPPSRDDDWEEDSPDDRDPPPANVYDSYERYVDDYESEGANIRGHGYGQMPPAYPRAADLSNKQFHKPSVAIARDHEKQRVMKIEQDAPPLPSEMKFVPSAPRDCVPPREKLYFSRQPRNIDYKPYSLAEWKMNKPQGYVEIKPTLQPDLNTDVLVAKRANQERIKEFSKNLHQFNQRALQQQKKLPKSAESNDIRAAENRILSKRERAMQFAQNIPKPKVAGAAGGGALMGMSTKLPFKSGPHAKSEAMGDEDWSGKDSLDHDYMNMTSRDTAGMCDVEFRQLEKLEQKHNDSARQIAAIKKSLNL